MTLFHVSEEAGIARFDPRPAAGIDHPVVWAVHGDRLRNYLLPRDCPRVAYQAGVTTAAADIARFLGPSPAVVAFEAGWLERIRNARLFVYHFTADGFEQVDINAGYFQTRDPVVPERVEVIDDPLTRLVATGVEVRILPTLWPLHDEVLASTLSYSMIRMRNAIPRQAGTQK